MGYGVRFGGKFRKGLDIWRGRLEDWILIRTEFKRCIIKDFCIKLKREAAIVLIKGLRCHYTKGNEKTLYKTEVR